jgi:hypothetical protein
MTGPASTEIPSGMQLLDYITALSEVSSTIGKLRKAETEQWRLASLATNERVTAMQQSRNHLANAISAGLPVLSALNICERFSLLDLVDVDHLRKANSEGRIDVARFIAFLRRANIHNAPSSF